MHGSVCIKIDLKKCSAENGVFSTCLHHKPNSCRPQLQLQCL